MTIEERRAQRQNRMSKLYEAINNVPDVDGKGVHGEVDLTMFDAIEKSRKNDQLIKDAFKEKYDEVRNFIRDQDKATGAAEEDKAENRLFLDENLFPNVKEK